MCIRVVRTVNTFNFLSPRPELANWLGKMILSNLSMKNSIGINRHKSRIASHRMVQGIVEHLVWKYFYSLNFSRLSWFFIKIFETKKFFPIFFSKFLWKIKTRRIQWMKTFLSTFCHSELIFRSILLRKFTIFLAKPQAIFVTCGFFIGK